MMLAVFNGARLASSGLVHYLWRRGDPEELVQGFDNSDDFFAALREVKDLVNVSAWPSIEVGGKPLILHEVVEDGGAAAKLIEDAWTARLLREAFA